MKIKIAYLLRKWYKNQKGRKYLLTLFVYEKHRATVRNLSE